MPDQFTDPPDWGNIPPVLSAIDVALVFNVNRMTVYRWIKEGRIQSYKWFGTRHIFPREYILEFAGSAMVEQLSAMARSTWEISEEQMQAMQINRREKKRFYEKFGMRP